MNPSTSPTEGAHTHVEVVPLGGVPGRYTYAVPEALIEGAVAGRRVAVPFGTRLRVGVIVGPATKVPEGRIREIESLLDDDPLVRPGVLQLCQWAADYYDAPLSHALRAALPPGALGRETSEATLTEAGREALRGGGHPASVRRALLAIEAGEHQLVEDKVARALERDGLVSIDRSIRTQDAPEVEVAVFCGPAENPVSRRSPVQRALYDRLSLKQREPVRELVADHGGGRAALEKLVAAGWVRIETVPWRPEDEPREGGGAAPKLTEDQANAVRVAGDALQSGRHQTFLLEGVTGSGKTEVYLRLIAMARAAGGGALVVVPEIALTPQLAARFRARFGGEVAVLHSGLTDRERTSEWHRIHRGEAPIVVGARSGLFAPLEKPRVIIVDEEHDPSFKQESGLRYHGRDLAVVRGMQCGAVVVLGSATPSLETIQNVRRGRYTKLALPKRVDDRPLPKVELVDLRGRKKEKPEGGMTPSGLFSDELVAALRETLERREQSIVFLNRRGHSTALLCRDCGEACRCEKCAVAYTWHERRSRLICHHCGDRREAPDVCPACGSARLLFTGSGTEKIEDELALAAPGARIARLDRDTAQNSRQLSAILDRFARREIDILVGTQMVTKGHDFPGVTLVCVLVADAGLHQPDFRASERTAQLLTQVAGRAGRGKTPGRVIVQSFTPDAPAVAAVATHDYAGFAALELADREAVGYPPFRRLGLVRVEGEEESAVVAKASAAARALKGAADVEVLGPAPAPRPMLRGQHRYQLLIKSARHEAIRAAIVRLDELRAQGAVHVVVDIDPVDLS